MQQYMIVLAYLGRNVQCIMQLGGHANFYVLLFGVIYLTWGDFWQLVRSSHFDAIEVIKAESQAARTPSQNMTSRMNLIKGRSAGNGAHVQRLFKGWWWPIGPKLLSLPDDSTSPEIMDQRCKCCWKTKILKTDTEPQQIIVNRHQIQFSNWLLALICFHVPYVTKWALRFKCLTFLYLSLYSSYTIISLSGIKSNITSLWYAIMRKENEDLRFPSQFILRLWS
jgi:hypothetical protein